jgi:hypothetical protein
VAKQERSYFWVCFWLALCFFALNHIGGDLDKIVRVIEQHAGEDDR